MAYTPREIRDRVAVGDDIFLVEDLGDNRIRLIPAPTHVSEAGTPVNKALLQPIEDYLATGVVPVERTITAGNGLSGGGSLTTNRTLSVDFGKVVPAERTITAGNGLSGGGSLTTNRTLSVDFGKVVPVERTITAGNGLSGGGTLAANRTLSLGTPGTLSGATSNNVTDESHTHAISAATQAEAEAGTNNVKLMTPQRTKQAITALQAVKSVAGKTGAVTLTASDLPSASTSAKGVVQLSTSTSSTSTSLAATPSAVKAAYDLANGKADSIATVSSRKAGYAVYAP